MHAYHRHQRFVSCLLLAVWIGCLWNVTGGTALAHSGHDHGNDAAATLPQEAEPRFSAEGSSFTLVGILKSRRVWLYADATDTNQPLDDLRIEVDIDGVVAPATPDGHPGRYVVDADGLTAPGRHPLVFTVGTDTGTELLTATLDVPPDAAAMPVKATPPWNLGFPVMLVGGLLLFAGWRRRRGRTIGFASAVMWSMSALGAALLSGAYAFYAATSTAAAREVPPSAQIDADLGVPDTRARRLADGTAFVPKPAHSLLELSTLRVHQQSLPPTRMLPGRVVHDASRMVVVQAEQSGRLTAPPQGFPQPGTRVKRGELLAYLEPVVSALDRARQQADLASLEKDLYLNRRQTERVLEQLGAHDTSASVSLEVSRAEQAALEKRIDLLRAALTAKLALTAPADGIIGESHALNGAVVPAGAQVFSIVDPTRFRLQALAEADIDTQQIRNAHAVLEDGRSFPLAFTGHGFQLSQQALPLQFRALADMPALPVGKLLDIRLQMQDSIEGLPVPHAVLLPAPAGNGTVVWVRTAAERFEARQVQTQAVDDKTTLVVSGLSDGDRVVSHGANLLSMIPY